MASSDDSNGATDERLNGEQPIVVHSRIHGENVDAAVQEDIESWNPPSPEQYARTLPAPAPKIRVVPASVGSQSPPPPELTSGDTRRAFALDALRGLFLISMTCGFVIASDHLPDWMYHRQFPHGSETPINVAGITWRDLAYASFLFTMAAALPLTLSRKIAKGELEIGIIIAAFRRYALLLVYAVLIGHANTGDIGFSQTTRLISIAGFVIMGMIFTRRRSDWNEKTFKSVNIAGWVLAVVFLALTPLVYGKTFSPSRTDEIITGLAFASLFGALIWYFTRDNVLPRLAILGVAIAMYLGAKGNGWVSDVWWDPSAEWAFSMQRFTLLAVVVPGTIAGDVILRWMNSAGTDGTLVSWSRARLAGITLVCFAFTPIITWCYYNRYVEAGAIWAALLLVGGTILTWGPTTPVERMIRSLFLWAAAWLAIGMPLEPFEGGIHKVPDNLSYYFTVTGTTSMLLVSLTALIDALGKRKWVATLIDMGHNPLLLYVLFTVLFNSIFEMIPPLRPVLMGSIPQEMVRYTLEVLLVIVTVRFFSRRRIYWRT
jgi:predicted acyltransferase